MRLRITSKTNYVTFVDDCCDHDLVMIANAMHRYHTRWLRRRKPQTVDVQTAKGRYVFLVGDISSVSLEVT
jgi:hypothetical protein